MTLTRAAKIALPLALVALAAAGAAGAYLLAGRQEVTTSSAEALRLYREARENEQKLYVREAVTGYAGALEQDPRFFMAKVRLAANMAGRDRERAASLLAAAGRSLPDVKPRERLAWKIVDAQVRRDKVAVAEYVDELLALYPDEPEGYQLKAGLLEREGKHEEAIAQYEKLLSKNPNFAIAYNTLGYYLMYRGDSARAEEYFKRYRFLAPNQANPYDSLGELYIAAGRWDEAEASLKKAQEVKPDFFAAEGHLGTLAVARGEWAAAARHFARMAELFSEGKGVGDFRVAEVLSLVHAGDLPGAERVLDAWEKSLSPGASPSEKSTVHVVRAVALAQSGRLSEAAVELQRGAVPPGGPGAEESDANWAYLSRTLNAALALRSGKGTDADAAAVRAPWPTPQEGLGYYPAREDYRTFLAESLAVAGRRGEAVEMIDGILAKSPRCRPALEARARLTGEATAGLTLSSPALPAPPSAPVPATDRADAHAAPAR